MTVTNPTYELVPAAEAEDREVRPEGWSRGLRCILVEQVGDGWVRLLWDMDDRPPTPYTMFRADEMLEVWW